MKKIINLILVFILSTNTLIANDDTPQIINYESFINNKINNQQIDLDINYNLSTINKILSNNGNDMTEIYQNKMNNNEISDIFQYEDTWNKWKNIINEVEVGNPFINEDFTINYNDNGANPSLYKLSKLNTKESNFNKDAYKGEEGSFIYALNNKFPVDIIQDYKKTGNIFRECQRKKAANYFINTSGTFSDALKNIKKEMFDFQKRQKKLLAKQLETMYVTMHSYVSEEAIAEYIIMSFMWVTSMGICKVCAESSGACVHPLEYTLEKLSTVLSEDVDNKKSKSTKKEKATEASGGFLNIMGGMVTLPMIGPIMGMLSGSVQETKKLTAIDKKDNKEVLKNSFKGGTIKECQTFVQGELSKGIKELFSFLETTIKLRKKTLYECNNKKLQERYYPVGYEITEEKMLKRDINLEKFKILSEMTTEFFSLLNLPLEKINNFSEYVNSVDKRVKERIAKANQTQNKIEIARVKNLSIMKWILSEDKNPNGEIMLNKNIYNPPSSNMELSNFYVLPNVENKNELKKFIKIIDNRYNYIDEININKKRFLLGYYFILLNEQNNFYELLRNIKKLMKKEEINFKKEKIEETAKQYQIINNPIIKISNLQKDILDFLIYNEKDELDITKFVDTYFTHLTNCLSILTTDYDDPKIENTKSCIAFTENPQKIKDYLFKTYNTENFKKEYIELIKQYKIDNKVFRNINNGIITQDINIKGQNYNDLVNKAEEDYNKGLVNINSITYFISNIHNQKEKDYFYNKTKLFTQTGKKLKNDIFTEEKNFIFKIQK